MQPYNRGDLVVGLRDTPLAAPTRTRAIYSNFGFGVLGHVIERATGGRYEEVLTARILKPLEMTSTSITITPARERTLARHYWYQDPERKPQARWVFGEVSAFGGLVSTVPDLAKYLSFQLRRGVPAGPLSDATRAEMQRPQTPWLPGLDLGIAWQIWHSRALGDIVQHGGEVDGHGSFAAFSPGLGVGVVVLTNLGGPTSTDLGEWLLANALAEARRQISPTRDQANAFSQAQDRSNAKWAWVRVSGAAPNDGEALYRLGVAAFNLDQFEQAIASFQRARALKFNPASVDLMEARANAALGRTDAALKLVESAVGAGYGSLVNLAALPEFDSLRSSPRWAAITAKAVSNR
jgi:hypothetical protein